MTWFQVAVLPPLALLFVLSVRTLFRPGAARFTALSSATVWLAASVTITWPDLTTRIANRIGIGRGADFVLYLAALAGFALAFHLYKRISQLETSISKLVRHAALQDFARQTSPWRGDGERVHD